MLPPMGSNSPPRRWPKSVGPCQDGVMTALVGFTFRNETSGRWLWPRSTRSGGFMPRRTYSLATMFATLIAAPPVVQGRPEPVPGWCAASTLTPPRTPYHLHHDAVPSLLLRMVAMLCAKPSSMLEDDPT